MPIFHDEEDGNRQEPLPGLPAELPDGEELLLQVKPSAFGLMIHALHVRFLLGYILVVGGIRAFSGVSPLTTVVLQSFLVAGLVTAILYTVAWLMARAAIFSITTHRVFFRVGAGIRKYINIPFTDIQAVDLRERTNEEGDIALTTTSDKPIPYLHLWPFARPLRMRKTVPLLRCVPNARATAERLAAAMQQQPNTAANARTTRHKASEPSPTTQPIPTPSPMPVPAGT